jgi:hypothetical protein
MTDPFAGPYTLREQWSRLKARFVVRRCIRSHRLGPCRHCPVCTNWHDCQVCDLPSRVDYSIRCNLEQG